MPKPIIRKWWISLIQGIILIILSIYIFNNPLDALKGISIWIGILILFTGLVGIISWMAADRDKKASLLWSFLTIVFGIILLLNLFTTTRIVEILFGLWMVFLGLHFIEDGLVFKKHQPFRWATVIAGALCIIAAVVLIFDLGTGIGVSLFIGVQILLAGIALVIVSFARKELVNKIMDRARHMSPESYP
jgi:uncharacterized membrane protein HdeD (DUF308 family)